MDHQEKELILVTGGCGFVGRAIVERLLAEGYRVRVFDMDATFEDDRVQFIIGDLRNREDVKEAVEGVHTVFHVAALTSTSARAKDYYDVNVMGTAHLLDSCVDAGVCALVYTSSTSVVVDGSHITNASEKDLPYPQKHLDAYSESKARAEQLVLQANNTRHPNLLPQSHYHSHSHNAFLPTSPSSGNATSSAESVSKSPSSSSSSSSSAVVVNGVLLTCALRPHIIFGPRDPHFLPKIVQRARRGEITHRIGDGDNVTDVVYIDNVVDAHLLAMQKLLRNPTVVGGQTYFITNGEPCQFWGFLESILDDLGLLGPTKNIPSSVAFLFAYSMDAIKWVFALADWHVLPGTLSMHTVTTMACDQWFNHHKAMRDLAYKPAVSLATGMQRTVDYLRMTTTSTRISKPLTFQTRACHNDDELS